MLGRPSSRPYDENESQEDERQCRHDIKPKMRCDHELRFDFGKALDLQLHEIGAEYCLINGQ